MKGATKIEVPMRKDSKLAAWERQRREARPKRVPQVCLRCGDPLPLCPKCVHEAAEEARAGNRDIPVIKVSDFGQG